MRDNPQSPDNKGPIIAIDGPVASGKSSVGLAAARRLGLRFLDTGVMYRAVTWLALRQGMPVTDANAVVKLAAASTMAVDCGSAESAAIVIDGHILRQELTTAEVDRSVSAVAGLSGVRRALVQQQRDLGADGSIVMAGRDIGSVVLPHAEVKIYIDASAEERALRRWRQQLDSNPAASYRETLADTIRRDTLDRQRSDSPLTVANGAVIVNTDGMEFPETVCAVLSVVRGVCGVSAGPMTER